MPALMILGLRRSGTTAFWKQFRRDRNLKCFDEPFSEQLIRLPSEHPKMVWSEYRDIFDLDPSLFWRYYAPIHRVEELRSDFHPRQATYINWLAQQSKNTVFDLTRCHLKLEALSELLPDARVIHLKRSRSAFTSSHLIPSRSGRFGKLRSLGYTRSFWDRKSGFDSWGMESLAGTSPASAFGLGIGRLGGDAEAFYRAPACVRLGVMWEWFGWHVDREGPRLFGSRFASVSFESFTRDPENVVRSLCEKIAFPEPVGHELNSVRIASNGYRPSDARWKSVEEQIQAILPVGDC